MKSMFLFSAAAEVWLFLFLGALPVKTAGPVFSPDTGGYSIYNCVNEFDPAKVESTKAGYQYWFADKKFADGKTVKLSVVRPHEATHAPHRHAEDEFFFVLQGKAEFYLGGKTKVAGPYTSLYCPSNVEHGIRNAGDTELRYLVIKKYETK
jgi:mannose-6-phosphate isomerase-like protein (cupin superfamily)